MTLHLSDLDKLAAKQFIANIKYLVKHYLVEIEGITWLYVKFIAKKIATQFK